MIDEGSSWSPSLLPSKLAYSPLRRIVLKLREWMKRTQQTGIMSKTAGVKMSSIAFRKSSFSNCLANHMSYTNRRTKVASKMARIAKSVFVSCLKDVESCYSNADSLRTRHTKTVIDDVRMMKSKH